MSGKFVNTTMKALYRLFFQVDKAILLGVVCVLCLSCKKKDPVIHDAMNWKEVSVSASAYNSIPNQTTNVGNPLITAFGDTLKPGKRSIAVSRDLIKKGLTYNTPVRIDGLQGIYFVKDKMHHRWRNKIDIYMGENVDSARIWGRKKVLIHYLVVKDSINE